MKAVDHRYKLGGAPTAVPVTEVERIPTWQEVAQVHAMNRRLEEYLPSVTQIINWPEIELLRDALIEGGVRFFQSALSSIRESGLDVKDPAVVLMVMKRLGSVAMEELFGAGSPDAEYPRGRRPVLETGLVRQTINERARVVAAVRAIDRPIDLRGLRVAVASTDIHEFAKFVLESALTDFGGRLIDVGLNRDPEDIVQAAVESAADAIVITTHNGVARSFAQTLKRELHRAELDHIPVYMGGVLNEDIEGSDIPVNVQEDLIQLGVIPLSDIEGLMLRLSDLAGTVTDVRV
jgi:methylmalonyl-CoA mutase cobalamin-binding domain/chain